MTTATIDEVKSLFEDFKTANDARLKEIEAKGKADPLLEKKVDDINAEISSLTDEIKNKEKEDQKRVDDLELKVNRLSVGPNGSDKNVEKEAREFFSMVNQRQILPGEVDVQAYSDYKPAFDAYLRKGDKAINRDYQNAMSVGSDPDGGYWVTPDTTGRIATLVYESSPMRQVANVVTIGTDALEGTNDLDEDGSGGWVGEAASRGDTTTPQIGMWRIPVHEQFSQPKITQKLLDDSFFNVESWLSDKVASKLSRVENTAFITGDGVGKPRGFLTYAAGTPSKATWDVIQQTNSGAAGAFAATDPGDALIDLVFSLKSAYRQGASWMMSRGTLAESRKLKDGQGNYMWQPNFGETAGANLLGFPIVEAEDMPAIAADSFSIAFGNMNLGYQIVDRIGIRVLRDPFTDKPYIKFYTTKRVGGDVVNFEAIKIMKFAA